MALTIRKCLRCNGIGLEPNMFDIPKTSICNIIKEMKYREMDRLSGVRLIKGKLYYEDIPCSRCDGRAFVI